MKKTHYINLIILLLFVSLQILVSCSTTQKTAVACPTIPDARFNYKARHDPGKAISQNLFSKKPVTRKHASAKTVASVHSSSTGAANSVKEVAMTGNLKTENYLSGIVIDKNEYLNALTASVDNTELIINHPGSSSSFTSVKSKTSKNRFVTEGTQQPCDTIVSTMGDVIIGKVTEVTDNEIKYKRCGISDSPVYSIRKSNISVIKYANGTKDFFTASGPVDYRLSTEERRLEGLGLAGFISGIAGLFVLGIPLGLLAVIFGGISLSKIKRSSGRLSGKGYAIASLVLGLIDVIGMVILMAVYL
jgi:hypothetical protein